MSRNLRFGDGFVISHVSPEYRADIFHSLNSGFINKDSLLELQSKGLTRMLLTLLVVMVFVLSRSDVLARFGGDVHLAVQSILSIQPLTYRNHVTNIRSVLGVGSTFALFVYSFFRLVNVKEGGFQDIDFATFQASRIKILFDDFNVSDSLVRSYLLLALRFEWVNWDRYSALVEELELDFFEEVLLWVVLILPNDEEYCNYRFIAGVLNKSEWFVSKRVDEFYKKMNRLVPGKTPETRSSPLMLFTALLHYGVYTGNYLKGVGEG